MKDSEVIKAAIWNGMMTKERGVIRQIINAIGLTEGFKEINIYDQKGVLHYTSRQIKTPVQTDGFDDPLLNDLKSNPKIRHRISKHSSLISVVNPLLNAQSCSAAACHARPEDDPILGAVEVKIGLEGINREISQGARKTIVFATLLFLVVCSVSGAVVLVFVNPTIRNLQEKASKMARGEVRSSPESRGQR